MVSITRTAYVQDIVLARRYPGLIEVPARAGFEMQLRLYNRMACDLVVRAVLDL